MGPKAGLDRHGKSRPHRDSIPGPSIPQRIAIPTEPFRPTQLILKYQKPTLWDYLRNDCMANRNVSGKVIEAFCVRLLDNLLLVRCVAGRGGAKCWVHSEFNPLTPNDHYSCRTAPLTSKRCILYIYSTNIGTE